MARTETLRVAVVGAGPAGIYAARHLLGVDGGTYVAGRTAPLTDRPVEVDMFERLPTPHGLVRAGVAPDHPEKKLMGQLFDTIASRPEFTYFGNVEIGQDVTVEELAEWYDAVVYAFGSARDSVLGIPGEDLPGSLSARQIVGWYNGHPDHADLHVDLSGERAVIVGNGNVALDVARVLSLRPDELRHTDIAPHALAALEESRIREVVVMGRRSHLHAAFANAELEELGRLDDVDIAVDTDELALAERRPDNGPVQRKHDLLVQYAASNHPNPRRRIALRFLRTPTEILGTDKVQGLRWTRTNAEPAATDVISTRLVIRSVGYRGDPLPGLPFDATHGVVEHVDGRVAGRPGTYVTGWIKRGPTGVIGTNKKCS